MTSHRLLDKAPYLQVSLCRRIQLFKLTLILQKSPGILLSDQLPKPENIGILLVHTLLEQLLQLYLQPVLDKLADRFRLGASLNVSEAVNNDRQPRLI